MKLLKSSAVIGGFTLGSRLLGFARDVVWAKTLGADAVSDAFYTALQFPNLFRRIFAEGAFSQAFVPLFSRTLERDGEGEAVAIGSQALSGLFAATAALTIAAQILMPLIMLVMQIGYVQREDWDTYWLSVILTQITMPYLTGMSVAALFAGVLNTYSRFALAAAAPTLLNICTLIAALGFGDTELQTAYASAIAILVAGVLQGGLLYWGCRRMGLRLRLMRPRMTPALRRIIAIAGPGVLAASAVQINITISQSIASLEQGAKSWLNYADRLYQLPLGLVGVALGVAILPSLSRAVEADDRGASQTTMDQALAIAMALTLPAAAALMAIPTLLSDALFARGEFTSADAAMTGSALFHFAWGVPAFVLIKILAPAFYARHDTIRPMRYAVASVGMNILVGAGLFFFLQSRGVPGFPGLAIGTSSAAWLNAGLLFGVLFRDDIYRPGRDLCRRLAGIVIATAAMAAVLLYAASIFPMLRDAMAGSKELAIAPVVLGGGAAYTLSVFLFGGLRLSDLRALARRRSAAG